MNARAYLAFSVLLCTQIGFSAGSLRSFVNDKDATNKALVVGVGHGLPGIDIDVKNVESLSKNDAYRFEVMKMMDEEGTIANIAKNLSIISEGAGEEGTAFFYFSGHGKLGKIWAQDDDMKIEDIRKAIEEPRTSMGPLARLVLMFDTCHAGSLIDPVTGMMIPFLGDERVLSVMFADEVVKQLRPVHADRGYYTKLMVFASSLAEENSMAGEDGSVYTNAMMKSFKEVSEANGTVGEFQKKSEEYTKGHHPVARFVPENLSDEKLVP